jgi:hypothetical protein
VFAMRSAAPVMGVRANRRMKSPLLGMLDVVTGLVLARCSEAVIEQVSPVRTGAFFSCSPC